MSQKVANAAALYVEGIRDGRVREAVEAYTGDRYTQHSTGVADGVEGFDGLRFRGRRAARTSPRCPDP